MTNKQLSEQAVARRKELGMSRYRLIKESMLSPNTIIAFEDTGKCTLSSFLRIAEILKMEITLTRKEQ